MPLLLSFTEKQGGQIGISLIGEYVEPYSESTEDRAAVKRTWMVHGAIGIWRLSKEHETFGQGKAAHFHQGREEIVEVFLLILLASTITPQDMVKTTLQV
ncbi:unnamed protein product [Prunus armeniaca]|nr:unnamed protein product [Prunus armeniaca]